MIKSHKEIYECKVDVIDMVLCDCCGKEIKTLKADCEDYLAIDKTWGYSSTKDGERHEVHICESCYGKWVQGFIHKPVDTNT